jgi:hypothetical protein
VENSQTSTPWYVESGNSPRADGNAGQQPAPVLQQAGQKASEMADQARTQVISKLDDQKAAAAGSLGSVAQALRQTGQQFREQDQKPFGQVAESAADMVDRFSGFLSERDIQQLIGEAEGFARRQPALFIGGAFALGLIAARFLKSSSDGSASGYAQNQWSRDSWPASRQYAAPGSVYDVAPTAFPAASATGPVSVGSISDTPSVSVDADDEELVPAMGDSSSARLNDDE